MSRSAGGHVGSVMSVFPGDTRGSSSHQPFPSKTQPGIGVVKCKVWTRPHSCAKIGSGLSGGESVAIDTDKSVMPSAARSPITGLSSRRRVRRRTDRSDPHAPSCATRILRSGRRSRSTRPCLDHTPGRQWLADVRRPSTKPTAGHVPPAPRSYKATGWSGIVVRSA